MVERLAKLRHKKGLDYQIIGVGGVMTPADFKAYRQAGADVVMSATGAMWNPGLANQVKASLSSQ
jgi:dihydroorotate dehydrogenase